MAEEKNSEFSTAEGLRNIGAQMMVMMDLAVATAGSQWSPAQLATWKAVALGTMDKVAEEGFDTAAEREFIEKFAIKIDQYMKVFAS